MSESFGFVVDGVDDGVDDEGVLDGVELDGVDDGVLDGVELDGVLGGVDEDGVLPPVGGVVSVVVMTVV